MERTIYLSTNVSCNLNCIYCYEDKSSKETFDLESTKQKLATALQEVTEEGTIIDLHGGEPFMVFPKIRELCEWLWAQNFPERFVLFATSNGTLIHGEIKEWLEKHKRQFIVGLSLDGTREMQNINRTNSFDAIDIDFIARTWPTQSVKMTISPKTLGMLADGIIFLHSKGFKKIAANLAYMVDWSPKEYLSIYARELRKLADFYLQNPDLEKAAIFKAHFPSILKEESYTRKWCGVGTNMCMYDIDGRAYPCHLFFESVCGKEKSEKAKFINFSDPEVYTSRVCRACPILPLCPTCYGSNYIERGDIGSRSMALCELTKVRIYELARYEYLRIVNGTDSAQLTNQEKLERVRILDALQKLHPFLSSFSVPHEI